MGRPRKYDERTSTNIRFPQALRERLDEEAEKRGVSVNWLVNRLVAEGMRDLIPVEEMRLTKPKLLSSLDDSDPACLDHGIFGEYIYKETK